MKKYITYLIIICFMISSTQLSVFAAADVNSESIPEVITGHYSGSGSYKDEYSVTRTFNFTWTNFKTNHDIAVLVTKYEDKNESYNLYNIYKNDNVLESVEGQQIRSDLTGKNPDYNVTVNKSYCDEVQLGSFFNGMQGIGVSFSSGCTQFSDYEDVKKYLADGTIGDSYIPVDSDNLDVEELPESKFIPPTDLKFEWNDNLKIFSRATGVTSDICKLTASWTNKNDISKKDIKTEFQISGVYYVANDNNKVYVSSASLSTDYTRTDTVISKLTRVDKPWTQVDIGNDALNVNFSLYDKSFLGLTSPDVSTNPYRYYLSQVGLSPNVDKVAGGYYLNYMDYKEYFRVRYYYIENNKKYVSRWVKFGTDLTPKDSTGTPNSKDSLVVTDDDDNNVDSDFYDNNHATSSSDVTDSKSFFSWLSDQIKGISSVLKSIRMAFDEAVNTGSSFVAMFKSYNSWLPATFLTMLVTGIGIVVLLRILGR